jgi:glutaredoxin
VSPVRRVVLYSRPGCHLCDEARRSIRAVGKRHRFVFEEVDIEADDGLLKEYGIRVPVVTVDGEERFEISVDERALAELVRL